MRLLTQIVGSTLAWLATSPLVFGQVASGTSGPARAVPQVTAGYELHRDHLRYTFENPSTIDTDFLVPHSFTQRYVSNNQWFVAAARYAVRGDDMKTEFAFTPQRQTPGSDLDTFFDPQNDVVVSGTNGEVRLRSWRFSHWSEGRLFGHRVRAGYSFRRDRAQFLPTDRIVTHTNPPSEIRTPTFGHETTISQLHQIPIDIWWSRSLPSSWVVAIAGGGSPIIFARLVTKLPDKYPGRDIVFGAKAFGLTGHVEFVRQWRWPVTVYAACQQTWGYRGASQFRLNSVGGGVKIASNP